MAACGAARKLQRNTFLTSTLFTINSLFKRSLRYCRHNDPPFGNCGIASSSDIATTCTVLTKRKLARSDVGKQNRPPFAPNKTTDKTPEEVNASVLQPSIYNDRSSVAIQLVEVGLMNSVGGETCSNQKHSCSSPWGSGRAADESGTFLWTEQLVKATSKTPGLCAPRSLHQIQTLRNFSRRRRRSQKNDNDDDDEEDDEEKKRRLRGAVMYITNPVTWVANKWNAAKLRRTLDPAFSESEFLFGSKQAISHVTHLVSAGDFEELKGLVTDEVVEWLRMYSISLSPPELEAFGLDVEDIVLMKIRYVELDTDEKVAFVDCVGFGLKVSDKVPYLVDMGVRFMRDYSVEPVGGWEVAGVTHIRLQNLS